MNFMLTSLQLTVILDITPRYTEEMVRKLNPENANDLLKSRVQCVK